jgi:hypothetical protein
MAGSSSNARFKASAFIFAFIVFMAIDSAVFRTGLYERIIKVGSAAGSYKYRRNFALIRMKFPFASIGVLGDSRIAEGFSARIFDEIEGKTNYRAINLAVPGSTLRVWYYLLSQIDPTHNGFDLIVVPMQTYSDRDDNVDWSERKLDVQFIMPFLSDRERFDVLQTYGDLTTKLEIGLEIFSRMYSQRLDLKEFLLDPQKRLAEVRLGRSWGDYDYAGRTEHLLDILDADKNGKAISEQDRVILRRIQDKYQLGSSPQTGCLYRYNMFWMSRITDLYKNSKTKVLVVKIPAQPIADLRHADSSEHKSLSLIAKMPNVYVSDEHLFDDLETPNYFFDDLHLNAEGRKIFTTRLSQQIMKVLKDKSSLAKAAITSVAN